MKTQLTEVIAENNKLSQNFQDVLTSKQSDTFDVDNEGIVSNLRQQINTLITEKEYVTKLWQEGIKTIDRLEDELKIFQAGTESFIPKKEFQKVMKILVCSLTCLFGGFQFFHIILFHYISILFLSNLLLFLIPPMISWDWFFYLSYTPLPHTYKYQIFTAKICI